MTKARGLPRRDGYGVASIRWYRSCVARATNFGDPSFEPTDEELAELMHEAFAEVPARNAEALARIHSEIAVLREQALARLEQRRGAVK